MADSTDFFAHCSIVPDPRVDRTKNHRRLDAIALPRGPLDIRPWNRYHTPRSVAAMRRGHEGLRYFRTTYLRQVAGPARDLVPAG